MQLYLQARQRILFELQTSDKIYYDELFMENAIYL